MIRRKRYITGNYMEIELFNLSPHKKPFDRARRIKESTPAQKNLNDKKSRKQFRRIFRWTLCIKTGILRWSTNRRA